MASRLGAASASSWAISHCSLASRRWKWATLCCTTWHYTTWRQMTCCREIMTYIRVLLLIMEFTCRGFCVVFVSMTAFLLLWLINVSILYDVKKIFSLCYDDLFNTYWFNISDKQKNNLDFVHNELFSHINCFFCFATSNSNSKRNEVQGANAQFYL